VLYDTSNTTATSPSDPHASVSNKLSVSTQIMTFGYSAAYNNPPASKYTYLTCDGNGGSNNAALNSGMITCGSSENSNPGENLVPGANVKIIKLTIFI